MHSGMPRRLHNALRLHFCNVKVISTSSRLEAVAQLFMKSLKIDKSSVDVASNTNVFHVCEI